MTFCCCKKGWKRFHRKKRMRNQLGAKSSGKKASANEDENLIQKIFQHHRKCLRNSSVYACFSSFHKNRMRDERLKMSFISRKISYLNLVMRLRRRKLLIYIKKTLIIHCAPTFMAPSSTHFPTLFLLRASLETSIKQFPRLFAMLIFVWVNITPVEMLLCCEKNGKEKIEKFHCYSALKYQKTIWDEWNQLNQQKLSERRTILIM